MADLNNFSIWKMWDIGKLLSWWSVMVTDCDAMLIFSVAVGMDLVAVLMDPVAVVMDHIPIVMDYVVMVTVSCLCACSCSHRSAWLVPTTRTLPTACSVSSPMATMTLRCRSTWPWRNRHHRNSRDTWEGSCCETWSWRSGWVGRGGGGRREEG